MTKLILIPLLFISLQVLNQTIIHDTEIFCKNGKSLNNTNRSCPNNFYGWLMAADNTTTFDEEDSPIMLYDSIYDWKLNTSSGIWEVDNKTTEIVYDEANKMVSETIYKWEYGVWKKDMLITYIDDTINNIFFLKYQSWNGSSWRNYWLTTTECDNSNNKVRQLFQIGYGAIWKNSNQYIYFYDLSNNLTSYEYQIWNDSTWENDFRREYSYNSNDDRLSELYQNWNGSNWVNFRKNISSYDSYGRVSNVLGLIWIGDNWHNSHQFFNYYEASGNLEMRLGQGWYDGIFVNSGLTNYTYDNNNNLLTERNSIWNDSIWRVTSQDIMIYDLNDNLINSTHQHLIHDTAWVNDYQTTFSFDDNSFRESYTAKSWSSDGSYITESDSSHYYFYVIVDNKEIESSIEKSVLVFPNPSDGLFIVKSKKPIDMLEVFDNTGVKISTFQNNTFKETFELDLSKYKSGYYFIVFRSKSESYVETIIIK
ncbi:MAG: T9SS type A sorting domain-containing protein [Bacteroidetes bacterium]|nr:T9SS type A sorting domain-containing protein [Bacteroidota bacterium]